MRCRAESATKYRRARGVKPLEKSDKEAKLLMTRPEPPKPIITRREFDEFKRVIRFLLDFMSNFHDLIQHRNNNQAKLRLKKIQDLVGYLDEQERFFLKDLGFVDEQIIDRRDPYYRTHLKTGARVV